MISEAPQKCGIAPTFEIGCISIASIPQQITELRQKMRKFLQSFRLTEEELADVEIAVGEACTNALKHGSPRGENDRIKVKCMVDSHSLIVEVSDNGQGFDPQELVPPATERLNESGMGVFLMRSLMDSVEFDFSLGTTVRLIKHCRPQMA